MAIFSAHFPIFRLFFSYFQGEAKSNFLPIFAYPLIQNEYRQEKIIFELFSVALQENPVRAPGAITGGALTGQGPIQETIFGELFSGALQENPVRAPGAIT